MLTVVTPASSRRLTTVDNVRADLGLAEGLPSDAQINRWIDQATAAVEKFCRRTFARETVLETFGACDLGRRIMLSRGPVTDVELVTWNGADVASAEYELDKGFLWRLGATRNGHCYFWGGSTLAVRYVAGYALPAGPNPGDLPYDVELAAIRLIGAAVSTSDRDPLVRTEDVGGVGSLTYWMPGARSQLASPEAEALLRPYRLMRVR